MCFTFRGRVKAKLRNANISSSLAKPCSKEIRENWERLFASCCWPPHPSSAFVVCKFPYGNLYLRDHPLKSDRFLKKSFFNNRLHPQFFNKNTTIQSGKPSPNIISSSGFLPNSVLFRHFFWRRAPVLGIKCRYTFSWKYEKGFTIHSVSKFSVQRPNLSLEKYHTKFPVLQGKYFYVERMKSTIEKPRAAW